MHKIAFYGAMGSGKTWAARYLVDNYGFVKIAFADKLKTIAEELFGVVGKDGKDRIILQQLGTKMREIDPAVWINVLLMKAVFFAELGSNIVLDDLRYLNEAEALRDAGFALIMVTAPAEVRLSRIHALYPNTPSEAITHVSEKEWQNIVPDATLNSVDATAIDELREILNAV